MSELSLLRGLAAGAPGPELLPLVLLLVAKATAILAAAGLAARLLGRAGAATRHLVWSCAVAALLLLPLFSLALPDWEVAVLRETGAAWMEAVAGPAALPASASAGEAPGAEAGPWLAAEPLAAPAGEATEPAGADLAAGAPPLSGPGWLALAWSVGALLVLLRLVVGQLGLRRLRRRSGPIDASFRWLAREMAGCLGMKRQVEMLRSRGATMPMTWGVVRPTILLPAESEEWPLERRRAVLLHELAHVKRLDCLTQTLALVCCALYWFHPGVWWAARRMRVERETACDDAVLGTGVRPSEYAAQLLEVARTYRGAGVTQVAAVAMARPSHLEGRMLAVLDAARDRSGLSRRTGALALAAVVALLLPVSALRPTAKAASAPDPGASRLAGDTLPGAPHARLRAHLPGAHDLDDPDLHGLGHDLDVDLDLPELDGTTELAWEAEEMAGAALSMLRLEPLVEGVVAGMEALAPRAPAAARRAAPAIAPRAPGSKPDAQADPRAVAALVEALRDADAGVRRAAAQGLGEMEAGTAVPALVQALRDGDAEVRRMAAWALGEIEDRRAVEGLVAALRDARPEVRRMGAWALGQIEDPAAAGSLVPLLRDASPEVRRMAAWALSQMEGPAAVPALVAALGDDSPEVRGMAAHALGEIGDRRAVDPLIAALRDPSPEVKRRAAWALAELEDPRAAAPLAAALPGASAEVSRMIVRALGEMDLSTAPPALLDAVRHADAEVRRAAVRALAEIADPRSVPALRGALRDADAEVRRATIRALVELDDPNALDALIEALKDPDAEVRRQAALAIADRG